MNSTEKNTLIINIEWEGPYKLDENHKLEINLDDKNKDCGIYQIYGTHPVYGSDSLLYIGKTEKQTFQSRLHDEIDNFDHWYDRSGGAPKIYIGRLTGKENPTYKEWLERINMSEKLLIVSHAPAYNASNIRTVNSATFNDEIIILNRGNYHQLLPEVSTYRWLSTYDDTYKEFETE